MLDWGSLLSYFHRTILLVRQANGNATLCLYARVRFILIKKFMKTVLIQNSNALVSTYKKTQAR